MLGGVFAFLVLVSVLVGAFNLVIDEYARGALQAAVEEGARAGASWGGSEAQCQAVADRSMNSLLHGPIGRHMRVTCTSGPGQMIARAYGTLPSLLPAVPMMRVDIEAVALTSTGTS